MPGTIAQPVSADRPPFLWRIYPYCYDLGVTRLAPYRQLQRDIVAAVRSHLRPRGHLDHARLDLLDVCCGTGNTLAALMRLSRHAQAVGLDFSPRMLDHAERKCRRLGRLRLIAAPAASGLSALPPSAFDVVTLCNGLYPLSDRLGVLREIRRVIRDDGVFVLTDPVAGARLSWLLRHHLEEEGPGGIGSLPLLFASAVLSRLIERHPAHRFCQVAEIKRLVHQAGFEVTSETASYGGANLLVACRPTAISSAAAGVSQSFHSVGAVHPGRDSGPRRGRARARDATL